LSLYFLYLVDDKQVVVRPWTTFLFGKAQDEYMNLLQTHTSYQFVTNGLISTTIFAVSIGAEIAFILISGKYDTLYHWTLITHYSILLIMVMSAILVWLLSRTVEKKNVNLAMNRMISAVFRLLGYIYCITAVFITPRDLSTFISLEWLMTYSMVIMIIEISMIPIYARAILFLLTLCISEFIAIYQYQMFDAIVLYLAIVCVVGSYSAV
jgi:hypothetical protein